MYRLTRSAVRFGPISTTFLGKQPSSTLLRRSVDCSRTFTSKPKPTGTPVAHIHPQFVPHFKNHFPEKPPSLPASVKKTEGHKESIPQDSINDIDRRLDERVEFLTEFSDEEIKVVEKVYNIEPFDNDPQIALKIIARCTFLFVSRHFKEHIENDAYELLLKIERQSNTGRIKQTAHEALLLCEDRPGHIYS